jgi:HlyD family secretion protein
MYQFPALQPAGPASPAPAPAHLVKDGLAEAAARHDDPRREIRFGASLLALFAVTTVAWATIIPLDAAVVAPGTVKVSGERQKVQAVGEGTVSAISVKNGDVVRAGQPLIDFAAPDLVASERSYASRVIALQAEIAGLEAEQAGTAIVAPEAFATYTGRDAELAQSALQAETNTLDRRRATAAASRSVLSHRLDQVQNQASGTSAQSDALTKQRALMEEEVSGIRALAAKGYASRNRLLELERSEAELAGNSANLNAEVAKLHSSAGEARMAIAQDANDRQQQGATRLRDARAELQSLLPQWAGAKAQLARMQLRAPVSGTVVGLTVHTIGGVAERGQTMLEIVPSERALTIEAETAATDGNEVHPGKPALLRLTGLHGRGIPELHGTVTDIAADVQTDERTGRTYYPMHVRVAPDELARFAKAVDEPSVLRPGNPVQVVVTTRSRSALQYWLEPLAQIMGGAMHER